MKFPFFKSLILAGALVVAWNCSDSGVVNSIDGQAFEQVKELNLGNESVFINDNNEVKDKNGNIIGSFDPSTGEVINTQGEKIAENVNKDELENTQISTGDNSQSNQQGSNQQNEQQGNPQNPSQQSSDNTQGGQQNPTQGGQQNPTQGGQQDNPQSGQQQGGSNTQTVTSSDCNQNGITGCQTFNAYPGADVGKIVIPNANDYPQWGNWSMQDMFSIEWSYDKKEVTLTVKIPADKAAGTYTDVLKVGNKEIPFKITISGNASGGPQSGGQQTQSSNSQQQPQQPKSSSSQQQQQPKSSSSVSGGGQQQGSSKYPDISSTGQSGWASRYWDGCKPSCGWTANSPNRTAHSCSADGKTRLSGYDDRNIMDGGNAGTCLDQSPIVEDGIAYAFAASHTNGDCGKCFLLQFDGTSRDGTNTSALAGKKMVIMISNIGGDVGGTQFDIMIPGGGLGAFDCIQGSNPLSAVKDVERYGGILTTCGGASNGANLSEVKTCIKNKCNKINDTNAKNGCLFMADWYEAANNPNFKAKEVDCPSQLTSRY